MKVPGTPSEEATLPCEPARRRQLCTASGTAALEARAVELRLAARAGLSGPRAGCALPGPALPPAPAARLTRETTLGAGPSTGEARRRGNLAGTNS